MVFGNVLSRLAEFRLDAADGQAAIVRNTAVTRAALKLIGVPHMGLRIRASLVIAELRRARPISIVDAGSGNGLYTLELAARGFEVRGIELDAEKVARVQAYIAEASLCNASVERGDLTQPTASNRQADAVICSDVLEHIDDDRMAAKALAALTRSGGTLLVTANGCSRMLKTSKM